MYQVFFGQTKTKKRQPFLSLHRARVFMIAGPVMQNAITLCIVQSLFTKCRVHPNTADVIFHGNLPATVKLYVCSTGIVSSPGFPHTAMTTILVRPSQGWLSQDLVYNLIYHIARNPSGFHRSTTKVVPLAFTTLLIFLSLSQVRLTVKQNPFTNHILSLQT